MQTNKATLALPILMILMGGGWLATVLGYAPGIDWIWTIAIASIGIAALLAGGWNKVTFVVSSFFFAAATLSVVRQRGLIPLNVEVPVLVIFAGVLLLIARASWIPKPNWVLDPNEPQNTDR